MDTTKERIIPLRGADIKTVSEIGSKARNLAICDRENFKTPKGLCLTTQSYKDFVKANRLDSYIDWEITRKPFEDLRWEEIWDASLRIRLSFLKGKLTKEIEEELKAFLSKFDKDTLFSVRSSSPDEDSKEYSFAGIHESFINISGQREIIEKIKLVWASLWSDRSLLYRNENLLDSINSSMAVVIQVMEPTSISGIIFTINPSNMENSEIVIETIHGSLNLLVDNKKSPDRIVIDKQTGEIKEYKSQRDRKLLSETDLDYLYKRALEIEEIFDLPVDIEWTGLLDDFTILQVRPITIQKEDQDSDRKWYLTLTPGGEELLELTKKVEKDLIPKLRELGEEFSKISPETLSRVEFLKHLKERGESYDYWLKVYWDDFIPLAHGIRHFGVFYNDLMTPEDPYEFVNLLKTQSLLAYERNSKMKNLANDLIDIAEFRNLLEKKLEENYKNKELLNFLKQANLKSKKEYTFVNSFLELLEIEMDVIYDNTKLESTPEIILRVILNLSKKLENRKIDSIEKLDLNYLYEDYIEEAKNQNMLKSAEKWLMVGRVSWKLRDDDNILLGRVENQLLKFIEYGIGILKSTDKKIDIAKKLILSDWKAVYDALTTNSDLLIERQVEEETLEEENIQSRQLMGQPSSSGVYTGIARIIKSLDDFKDVKDGEVLVFDSVQPQMTFIISLAGAIIERRGGMLVHSSIIAREMNIPAVNGVNDATRLIKTGDMVTVNGDLGVVVIGSPDFNI